jgi:uncharacterized protein (TIGR03067 family)
VFSACLTGYSGSIGIVDEIAGTWRQVHHELAGETVPSKGYLVVIRGDAFTPIVETSRGFRIALDASASPVVYEKRYDKNHLGERAIARGVLKFDGPRLILCQAFGEEDGLPKTFEAPAGRRCSLLVWENLARHVPESESLAKRLEGDWLLMRTVEGGVEKSVPLARRRRMTISGEAGVDFTNIGRNSEIVVHNGSNRVDFYYETPPYHLRSILDYDRRARRLTISTSFDGIDDYPTDFSSRPGSRRWLTVYQKAEADSP